MPSSRDIDRPLLAHYSVRTYMMYSVYAQGIHTYIQYVADQVVNRNNIKVIEDTIEDKNDH